MSNKAVKAAYALLTSRDAGRGSGDMSESIRDVQPSNFFKHVFSLASTKTGDGLSSPKLVLSWLLNAMGAPAFMVGLLVPIREAGSLLPQLFTADYIRRMPHRKWAWVAGSVVQSICIACMGATVLLFEGKTGGSMIVGLLAVFAIARSVSSVSYKDVLGKTVAKSTRGTATGTAGSIASGSVFCFGLLIATGVLPLTTKAIAIALFVAAGLWLFAAGLFSTLTEERSDAEGAKKPANIARKQLHLLKDDPQLRRFILGRGLLTATALAPPYLLIMTGREGNRGLGDLGLFVIISAVAGMCSTYIWGRLADKSSRKVLILAGLIAAVALALAGATQFVSVPENILRWHLPAMLLLLMVAYQGVRLGRSTHLVDMAAQDTRAAYTAISNTAIGIILLISGAFGALAQTLGVGVTLLSFAAMSVAAAFVCTGLKEVQKSQ